MIFEMGRRRDGGPFQILPQSPHTRLWPNDASGYRDNEVVSKGSHGELDCIVNYRGLREETDRPTSNQSVS